MPFYITTIFSLYTSWRCFRCILCNRCPFSSDYQSAHTSWYEANRCILNRANNYRTKNKRHKCDIFWRSSIFRYIYIILLTVKLFAKYSCFHLEPIHFEHYQYNLGNDSRIKRSSNRSPFQTFMISMNKMRGADWRQWSDHAGSNLEDMGDMMIEANNKLSEAVRYLYGWKVLLLCYIINWNMIFRENY